MVRSEYAWVALSMLLAGCAGVELVGAEGELVAGSCGGPLPRPPSPVAGVHYTDGRSLGFDPGMTLARIAQIHPDCPNYFEDCPDGPEGRCFPSCTGASCVGLSSGGGFYTLIAGQGAGTEQECLPNTPGCPYGFRWLTEGGARIARFVAVNRGSPNNFGWGIMTYDPFGASPAEYGGVSSEHPEWTPFLGDIARIELRYRARLCPGPAGAAYAATAYHYLIAADPVSGEQWTIVTHLFESEANGGIAPVPRGAAVMDEVELGAPDLPINRHGLHVRGDLSGAVTGALRFRLDPSCSIPLTEPLIPITIDVQRLIETIASTGRPGVTAETLRALRLRAEIIAGGEVYLSATAEVDIAGHRLVAIGDPSACVAPPAAPEIEGSAGEHVWQLLAPCPVTGVLSCPSDPRSLRCRTLNRRCEWGGSTYECTDAPDSECFITPPMAEIEGPVGAYAWAPMAECVPDGVLSCPADPAGARCRTLNRRCSWGGVTFQCIDDSGVDASCYVTPQLPEVAGEPGQHAWGEIAACSAEGVGSCVGDPRGSRCRTLHRRCVWSDRTYECLEG